jgi:hypothetical protein
MAVNAGWQEHAACGGHLDLFFGPDDEKARERRRRVAKAQRICACCPVRVLCLSFARSRRLKFGVWGGEDFEQPRPLCRNNLHLMDVANTWVDPDGHRNCRACRNAADQRARQRQEGEAA